MTSDPFLSTIVYTLVWIGGGVALLAAIFTIFWYAMDHFLDTGYRFQLWRRRRRQRRGRW